MLKEVLFVNYEDARLSVLKVLYTIAKQSTLQLTERGQPYCLYPLA